ncbi:helix-turn-helix transcriptional regulator [Duganella levis]|uniref:Helix-turn-helix domain-containing protein n=1 Tax=Duganella levis TaxID=2692169 RepID=A0ABW9VZC0_9BURK|nr:helix-turn-helix transcriptional regulator [Duganella levis]MYN26980.1 helix-turn-helix domain-containing protein [Duganella levis]
MITFIQEEINRIAVRVRAERKLYRLSQEELALKSGVSIRTYKRFESGECDSLAVMLQIARAFEEFTGHGRLQALERMFPGGVKETATGTALGKALQKLERTIVSKGKQKRKDLPLHEGSDGGVGDRFSGQADFKSSRP